MLTPLELITRFGGIARGTQLARYGLTRKQLAREVNDGRIQRLRPGVFATHDVRPDAIAAALHGGALTCSAALEHRGIWVLTRASGPHVWMGGSHRRHPHTRCRCTVHYGPGEMRLGIADIEHALVHAHACLGREFFFCAFESAWNKRLIGPGERARIRQALPASARWLVDLARSDSQSGLESLLRLRLHLLGIEVQPQVQIEGVGRVDFVIDGCVIIEADGRANHTGAHHHTDAVRDARASARGYETLRFDYELILRDWDTVLAAILAALNRARR